MSVSALVELVRLESSPVPQQLFSNKGFLSRGGSIVLPLGTARALVRRPFADTALGTLGAAHWAAGAAALLAGGALAVFAAAGAGAGAGVACRGDRRQQ